MKYLQASVLAATFLGLFLCLTRAESADRWRRARSGPGLSIRQDLSYLAKLLAHRTRSRARQNIMNRLHYAGKRSVDDALALAGQQDELVRHRRLSVSAPLITLAGMLRSRNHQMGARRRLQLAGKRSSTVEPVETTASSVSDDLINFFGSSNDVVLSESDEKFLYSSVKAFLVENLDQLLNFITDRATDVETSESSQSDSVGGAKE